MHGLKLRDTQLSCFMSGPPSRSLLGVHVFLKWTGRIFASHVLSEICKLLTTIQRIRALELVSLSRFDSLTSHVLLQHRIREFSHGYGAQSFSR